MELHESLAQLARDHGASLFTDADAFRGALDDYLDEGSASTGTINLLTDAVRLGALRGMLSMLDSGASVDDAVQSAGQRLSRDRGSADVTGSQWACAVLGYALGRVPVSLATRLRPDAYTAEPPAPSPSPGVPQAEQQATQQWPSPTAAPPGGSAPPTPPPPAPAAPPYAGQPSPYGFGAGTGPGSPRKSGAGAIVGAIVGVVLLGVVAIVAIVALSGGDDDPGADERTSTTQESSTPPSQSASESPATTTADPALTLQGSGYRYTLPDSEWQDLTDETPDSTGTIDTIAAPGSSITTARGNILVETSSAFGETDVQNLVADWKAVLEQSTGGTPVDIEPREIGGEPAVGVELQWTNANNFDVHQVAYLVISGDEQYSITASFRQGDSRFGEIYQEVLGTWVWEQ